MAYCARYSNRLLVTSKQAMSASSRLPTLADFITEHPEYIAPNNAMNFISDNGGASYNLCLCTSIVPSDSWGKKIEKKTDKIHSL